MASAALRVAELQEIQWDFLGLLPLTGLVLEQKEVAHIVLRALPIICELTWEPGLVHGETDMEQMPKCLLWPRTHSESEKKIIAMSEQPCASKISHRL